MRKLTAMALCSLLLAACSQESDDKVPLMLEGPLQARDKALGVQETLNQGAALQQQQIEQQTQQ